MKRIISVVMVVVFLFVFSACGGDDSGSSGSSQAGSKEDITAQKIADKKAAFKKSVEIKNIDIESQKAESLKAKTFYCGRNAMLYDGPDFNSETAVEAPHKGSIVIKRKIYEEVVVESNEEDSESDQESEDADSNQESTEAAPSVEKRVVAYELKSVEGKPSNQYVSADEVYPELYDFIEYPVEGVSYEPYPKTEYESNPPIKVRGVYVSLGAAANGAGLLDYLIDLARTTDINTFVIDVKDDSGYLLFKSDAGAKYMPEENANAMIDDIEGLIKKLKDEDIYLVARIVTFKGSTYAKKHPDEALQYKDGGGLYSDGDGVYWSSPYNRNLWDYNISLAEECADLGFNEIQFDYVRFPATSSSTDESLDFHNELNETKSLAVHNFLKEAHRRLSKKEVYVTADLFGWMASALDDQNIGQHWESLVNVVDYVAPMMYPSHYGPNNFGLAVPDANPYACIDGSIKDAISRNNNLYTPAKLRPWIQDFTATWVDGYIDYGPHEIMEQIRALKDNGVDEYMLWNAANYYSEGGLHGDKE